MTREKSEIMKKLNELDAQESAELKMGCGFGAELIGDTFERMRWPLLEKLAELQHYPNVEAMLYDDRGCVPF